MNEISVVLRLEAADGFADLLASRIATAVAEALARQTVLLAAQMNLGNADGILRAQSDAAAPAQPAPARKAPAPAMRPPPVTPPAAPEAVPETKAAAAVPRASPEKVWTNERNAHLKALRERGDMWPQIFDLLNKLPGPPIASADSCMVHWHNLKKRGLLDELPAVKLAPKSAKPPAPKIVGAARVSYETARHWAAERGLVSGTAKLDMEKVNAKRIGLGLTPFEIVAEGGRRVTA